MKVKETTKDLGVELYSAQEAAAILGSFLGVERRPPEHQARADTGQMG